MSGVLTDPPARVTGWEPKGVSEDGRTVTIEYVTSRCGGLDQYVARTETASAVTLTVIVRQQGHCDDIAVYRDGIWYIAGTSSGILITQFGLAGDQPAAGAYVP